MRKPPRRKPTQPAKASIPERSLRRFALGLMIAAVCGAAAGLWWTANQSAGINYLPAFRSADWISYPTAPDMRIHPDIEFPTRFRTSFQLKNAPSRAALNIAGFHRYTLLINGKAPSITNSTGSDWKHPTRYDLAGALQRGENHLEVTVYNSNAPPALWLLLDADGLKVRSGENWLASEAGAAWRTAVLASKARPVSVGCATYEGEEPWPALQARWPVSLLFAAMSAAGYWMTSWLGRRKPRPESSRFCRGEIVALVLIALSWAALFANNIGAFYPKMGYDSESHLAYIRFIQEHKTLPFAGDGWEMFQPPLYYSVCAKLLSLLSLSTSDAGGVAVLRILGFCCGLGNILLVWASLRLLFPQDGAKRIAGLVLAAFLSPLLFLSQYITNEGMAAVLATGSLYLCLRMLKRGGVSWMACAGLGICLGAALLAKATNLLLVPLVLGALLWRQVENREKVLWSWAGRMALVLAAAALVCGWNYARVWRHYGNPMIGNWDPRSGFVWWMEDGYHTASYYFRLGNVLTHPWYSGFQGFTSGIYSTLWGDGLIGGAPGFGDPHPPWNYDLMAVGYWLSLLPTAGILAGAAAGVVGFVRRPSAEWALLLGLVFLLAVAVVYMSLVVPCGGMVKAFYAMAALLPLCALGASGLKWAAARGRTWRALVWIGFGLWALNSYSSLWVLRNSRSYAMSHAQSLIREKEIDKATDFLTTRLETDPRATRLRELLISILPQQNVQEVKDQLALVQQQQPQDYRLWECLISFYGEQHLMNQAMEAARRSIDLAPGAEYPYQQLANMLMSRNESVAAARLCRIALAHAPASPRIRAALGLALLFSGRDAEAFEQFQYATRVTSDLPDQLSSMAWTLATNPDADRRNGALAIKLAKQACALTPNPKPARIASLAAAYAELGQYGEAVKVAEKAQADARASGDTVASDRIQVLIDTFKSGQAYRALAQ